MAALTIQTPVTAGITPTYAAAAGGGDTFDPTGADRHLIHIKNGGSTMTITVDDPTSTDPGSATTFNPDVTVSVTGGQERMILLDTARFTNTTTGLVSLSYSAVTTVTIGVFNV